jgi:hypothetical protein
LTEPIILACIIAGAVVAIAALVLNAGYRSWRATFDRETAIAVAEAGRATYHIHTDATPQEAEKAARDWLLINPN